MYRSTPPSPTPSCVFGWLTSHKQSVQEVRASWTDCLWLVNQPKTQDGVGDGGVDLYILKSF